MGTILDEFDYQSSLEQLASSVAEEVRDGFALQTKLETAVFGSGWTSYLDRARLVLEYTGHPDAIFSEVCTGFLPDAFATMREFTLMAARCSMLLDLQAEYSEQFDEDGEPRLAEDPHQCPPGGHDWYDGGPETGPCEPHCARCGAVPDGFDTTTEKYHGK